MLDVAEQDIFGSGKHPYTSPPPSIWTLTDFLRPHGGLVTKTVLVNLYFSRESLAVQGGPHKHLRELRRTPALDLDQRVLLDDVGHLLLLLLALVDLLLQICYLFREVVEAMTVGGTIRN